MNKKISLGITISLMIIASAITFILTSNFTLNTINKKVTNVSEKEQIYNKIGDIDTQVKQHFYGTVKQENVIDSVAKGYLDVLDDKYAAYHTAEENDERNQQQEGKTVGIGINVSEDDSKYIKIDSILTGSPAEANGLVPGSLIVAVDKQSVISLGYSTAVEKIKGKAGTTVTLTIRNDGKDQDVALTRTAIDIQSISLKMIDNIAYIQITDFNNKTPAQFSNAINQAKEKKAKALIFDLRNNLGGLLDPTLKMLDTLLPEGPIAYSTDKAGKITTLKTSDKNEVNLPMAVLVNSKTASASELFASALRDFDKGVLVGSNTYGKGVMQNTYQLSDGSSVTFTVGSFKTPKTANFDGKGLKPDYEVAMDKDSPSDLSKLDKTTDTQLKKAIEVLQPKIK